MITGKEKRKAIDHIAANIDRAEIRRKWWNDGREKYEIWLRKGDERKSDNS